jgi:hypothetical protein
LQHLAAAPFCFLTRLTHEAAITMNFLPHPPDLASVDFPQPGYPYAADHPPIVQQAYGSYGVDGTFGFGSGLQAQLPSDYSAITQPHPPHLSSPSPVLSNDKQHDAELVSNFQPAFAAPVSAMGPPAQPQTRKRKAPTLRADAWEPYKHRILELHVTQGLPLLEVGQKMEDEYGFKAKYVAPLDRR